MFTFGVECTGNENHENEMLLHAFSFFMYFSTSLRLGLLHEAKEMRAACLRALRYFCQDRDSIEALLRLHTDYLIAK